MKKKVLVVDDEENLRMLYESELEGEGFDVVTADSGEGALAAFDREKPDLVTMDIKMPGIGGIAALRAIREQNPDVPVVMLTAYPEFKADFDVWAADAYVMKSSDLTELMDKVKYLLKNK